jgi:hypothetical protein
MRGPFERARHSSGSPRSAEAGRAAAHLAMIKRFCMDAIAILAVTGALTAIMALKVAIFLPRLIHH